MLTRRLMPDILMELRGQQVGVSPLVGLQHSYLTLSMQQGHQFDLMPLGLSPPQRKTVPYLWR